MESEKGKEATSKETSSKETSSKSKLSDSVEDRRRRNPRAFGIQHVVKAERQQRRSSDLRAKRQRLPQIDRQPEVPPPKLVAVVGPPKVGKSTLVRNLVRNYCRQPLKEIRGPITVTCNKKQRITLLEVMANDVNALVDAAKVADVALVLIDASFGFEMEIFEFLSVCQAHGFPRIIGVLTHLDQMRNSKALNKTKKNLKHRFWTEVYAGAKLFNISGITPAGDYPKMEIHNLARHPIHIATHTLNKFISVMKPRGISWRDSHPYVLIDRMEDLTATQEVVNNPKCDRNVAFYGYVRGTALRADQMVHLAGVGDFGLASISLLPDPCPLPESRVVEKEAGVKKAKRRRLDDKERAIYAPMSGVGGILYDKDAVYVDFPNANLKNQDEYNDDGKALIKALAKPDVCVDQKLQQSELRIFSNSGGNAPHDSAEDDEDEDNNDDDEANDVEDDDDQDDELEKPTRKRGGLNRRLLNEMGLDADDVEDEDEDDLDVDNDDNSDRTSDVATVTEETTESKKELSKIKLALAELEDSKSRRRHIEPVLPQDESDNENDYDDDNDDEEHNESRNMDSVDVMANASRAFYERLSNTASLQKIVYSMDQGEKEESDEDKADQLAGLFKVVRDDESQKSSKAVLDHREDVNNNNNALGDWSSKDLRSSIRDCFVTGKWKQSEDAETILNKMNDSDEEVYGDFEDLTQEQQDDESESESEAPRVVKDEQTLRRERLEKKRRLKAAFDNAYDNNDDDNDKGLHDNNHYEELKREVDAQAVLNRSEFEHLDDEMRIHFEGYRSGMYVRMEMQKVPCELISNFDPSYPLIGGGVHRAGHEDQMGYVQVRLKKHRWYPRILKNRDPLILSLGWRRFQTLPVFSVTEHNMRRRMIKYTPEHMHCDAFVYAPITPQGSGCVALQSVASSQQRSYNSFRIAASGTVVEIDQTSRVVKKLKLTGTPFKVFKKTAFVSGMFHSSLEVAKFEGAAIQSVSGIRGQIKRALSNPEGAFRATFEDKLLMSDIVFVKTWVTIDIPKFYAPVTNLLLPNEQKTEWKGMRSVAELRRDHNIRVQPNEDQLYTEVKREKRVFNKLQIPRNLQNDLPFKLKPRNFERMSGNSNKERVHVEIGGREKKVRKLMKVLNVLNADQRRKQKGERKRKREEFEAKQKEIMEKRLKRQKEARQQVAKIVSQRESRRDKNNK